MALAFAAGIEFKNKKKVWVRVQEFNPNGNGRPYEEDMVESGLHADSIGDLPIPGDYLGLTTTELVAGTMKNPEFNSKNGVYKVLSRFIDFQTIHDELITICNIVVQQETNGDVIGRLVKD